MLCEIINIGDELLIGQVINTNASWLAEQVNLIGLKVHRITTIADQEDAIEKAITLAFSDVDVIFLTGGLGPTKDDITKTTLCKYFKTELVPNDAAMERNRLFFLKLGHELTEINRLQAYVPACCTVIENSCGTAPGMWFHSHGKQLISMPGVPFEMKNMMSTHILPKLQLETSEEVIVHKTIMTHGLGESFLADKIAPWEDALPSHIKLAYLPQPGILRLRLSAYGKHKDTLEKEISQQISQLKTYLSEYIYGYDEESLESIVFQLLKKNQQSLSVAESCSGGHLSHRLTLLPGISQVYKGGIIAYSNEVKINALQVSPLTLEKHGAVSEACVLEMAQGVRRNMNTDYGLAISGIAGPDGGSPEKPIGTVCIAVAGPQQSCAKTFSLGDGRDRIMIRAALSALNLLRSQLLLCHPSSPHD